jgi:hypothetical protein
MFGKKEEAYMRTKKAIFSEPMYDDCMLEIIEQHQTEELMAALVDYCKELEKQVIDLRCKVNKLTPPGMREPFPEPESDLYEVFHQYAAYQKFKNILKPLD